MDLLLVNVGNPSKRGEIDLEKFNSAIEPPVWAAMVAEYMRGKGFNVDIIDANADDLTHVEVSEKIEQINPMLVDIVVFGLQPAASTSLMPRVRGLCDEIKKHNNNRKVLLSGLHPSALPERTLNEEKCDYVAQGEGIITIEQLLNNIELNKIPGLWWKRNGIIEHTERPPNIDNLSRALNKIAWDLLPMDKYVCHDWHSLRDLTKRNNYASIHTSLGCCFNCSFCCINATFGEHRIRYWDPNLVLQWIDELVQKYNVRNLKIIDELFVFDEHHFMPIIDGLIERKYDLNLWAYARIDTMKKEYLPKFKAAGINWLAYGVESPNRNVRRSVNKGQYSKKQVVDVIKETKKAGINIVGHAIFGMEEDTRESMQENLNFSMSLNCEWMTMFPMVHYPGSQIYNEKVIAKCEMPDKWECFSPHNYYFKPFATKHLSPKEIMEFRDFACHTYYANPLYLNMIEKKFGIKAREHILNMNSAKLKREIYGDSKFDNTELIKG